MCYECDGLSIFLMFEVVYSVSLLCVLYFLGNGGDIILQDVVDLVWWGGGVGRLWFQIVWIFIKLFLSINQIIMEMWEKNFVLY